jgi:hypothetical protein|tara:strand:- start:237 stop:389 length:153 start_codon:yes stop_codon:yes gene_type:complete
LKRGFALPERPTDLQAGQFSSRLQGFPGYFFAEGVFACDVGFFVIIKFFG